MLFTMNWKSTAFVSGAGLIATWLASVPSPTTTLKMVAPQAQPASAQTAVSSEIAREADRLERRNRVDGDYNRPSRNLFRFEGVRTTARAASVAPAPVVPSTLEPQPLAIHLSGVAMDRVGEKDVWTAILSTPTGVVLAHLGDQVAPGWQISTIESESVGLTRPDGSLLILPLTGK